MAFVLGQQLVALVLLVSSAWQVVSGVTVTCPPVCDIWCEFGNAMDDAGCPSCACNKGKPNLPNVVPPPMMHNNMCCPDGYTFGPARDGTLEKCIGSTGDQAEPVACNVAPTPNQCNKCGQTCIIDRDIAGLCDLEAQCSLDYVAVEKSCPPEPACPPVCEMYCEFGNIMDDAGCPTCSCKKFEPNLPIACPPVCAIYCDFGNVMDDAGCPTCACNKRETDLRIALPPPMMPKERCCPDGYTQMVTLGPGRGGTLEGCTGPTGDETKPFDCDMPPISNQCNRCGQTCIMERDSVGLCDVEGKCSLDFNAVEKSCTSEPACQPVCAIYCEFGIIMDDAGCPTCACKGPITGTVRSSQGPNVATGSILFSSSTLHRIFAWVTAKFARVGTSSAPIIV